MDDHSILEDLFRERRFFELRDEVEKRRGDQSPELLFYRGAIANKFDRMRESIGFLEEYLKFAKPTDEKIGKCYELLGDNYAKIFQYRRAGECFKKLLEQFGGGFDEAKKQDAEYLYNLWSAAGDVPPQTISFAADTRVQAVRDKIGLLNLPVEINRGKINFIFDTGADVSSISASNAAKLGLKITECDISVGGASCRSNAKLTIAPMMKMGNVIIENIVLLVLADKDFYIEKYDYQINGVFGYQAIAAFRQITLTQKDEVFIPANAVHQKAEQNFCMDEMKPILSVIVDNQPMTFFVDTGASKTKFFPKLLESKTVEIEKIGKLQTASMTGVGGTKDYPAYVVDEFPLTVSGKTLKFSNAVIFTAPTLYQSEYHYGNIGQDWIAQFEKMTIDFTAMNIAFE
ncbi:MAG: aspartyl protease family protein [Pyrinomonadaceae bacterium]